MKRMARFVKTSRTLQSVVSPEILESLPSRDVCDALVECYLRTFEGVFRVLHIPTFRQEYEDYWTQTVLVSPTIILKILLVCAIGTPFYSGPNQARLRCFGGKWIQAATNWRECF